MSIDLSHDTREHIAPCDRPGCGRQPTVSSYPARIDGHVQYVAMVRCLHEMPDGSVCGRQIPTAMPNRADAVLAWNHMVAPEGIEVAG